MFGLNKNKINAEIAIGRKNRALNIVSGINQALIHITDENILLNDACRIAVDIGGYLLAWVGFAAQDKTKTVEVIARAGKGSAYLDNINIVWANNEYGRGPTGSAVRTGKTQMSRNISKDPKMIPWRQSAAKYGFSSSIALPLINNGKTFGVITIYSGEIDAFNEDEVRILEELANDLSFGIITQRNRVEQVKMAEIIKDNESTLREAQRIGHFGNWSWDVKTDKIVWSEEYYRIIGFDPKKAPPGYKDHLKIYTPESAARLDAAVKRNIKTGESYMLDLEMASPKATCRWITARSETVYDTHKNIIGLRGTAQDITQRKIDEQKLISLLEERSKLFKESQKLSTVVENTFEAIALIDLGKTNMLLYVNKAWENLFAYSKDEVVNKRTALILDVISRNPEIEKEFWNCIKNGKLFSGQIEWQKKNGEWFWADVNTMPLRDEEGNIYVWCNVVRDVTEAKKIDQMKSEFVSLASHQLRTPLTGIKWFSELLLRDPKKTLSSDQNEFANGILMSTNRIINLVDDLLDVSHIETGKNFDLKIESVDVIPLISYAINEKQPLIFKNNLIVELSKTLYKPLVLKIDKEKIQQVFENLLDNAIKFSKPGTKINIGVKINADSATFYVQDHGVGIPQVNQDKIFTKFYRADNASKIDNTGTGLGLYIVKGIIEYHHGKIWFESKEGKGTTFYFSLPLNVGRIKK